MVSYGQTGTTWHHRVLVTLVAPAAAGRLSEVRRGQDIVRQQSEAGIAAVISTLPRLG